MAAAPGDGNKVVPSSSDGAAPTKKKQPRFSSKSVGTAASLSKLLPAGTTLAFQTMAPSFTKGGECSDHDVNFVFTWGLISFLTTLCAALCFTDSVTDKHGHSYYGVATPTGFKLFNHDMRSLELAESRCSLMRKKRMKPLDFLHAVVSAAVFVAIALCDAGVQKCLIPKGSQPWKDFLAHLPLAVGFLASFLLVIFPSERKGIGEDDSFWPGVSDGDDDKSKTKRRLFDKSLGTVATLSRLLPTGTTLAFQTLAPSFANGGRCQRHGVNFYFTWGLIVFLTVLCAALSFTDSVTDEHGHTYYGVAVPNGFRLFDHHHPEESNNTWMQTLNEGKRMKKRDWVHAIVSAAVFVAIAFCDAGVQGCLVPEESKQWRQFLTLLPLGVGLVASFVFVIFPSERKGIGEESGWTADDEHEGSNGGNTAGPPKAPQTNSSSLKVHAMGGGITQVAPSSAAAFDQQLDSDAVV
ncbi:hypothetical protein HU200_067664 [Digitaria exilis]|uniref:Uncharacterized protein n=1 Tax=Digitaria exilis TaxID=1010633 RepID=A0A834ZZH9_9POAL|nr:hypothetical protein HU200_067664 [Digitaria exilis]CAB3489210.1 unnamed protein product [Digitaria exilis]